ncbi:hypothetical protein C8Q69DRAFT_496663 [Paecilomyces variotii]|uniref:Uncharacterized protein n=1 Tax=Byssochlamys spectabilis TaxID=264951 RepID=A0A443I340_BYSSP|nr:hypothetical protein C8Q69DRAFT_496663 [Paecilomyces variotii]RWQ98421.1 hypothetical protein C8Q69DRAFT_496663 [Paecilomyces variotii]
MMCMLLDPARTRPLRSSPFWSSRLVDFRYFLYMGAGMRQDYDVYAKINGLLPSVICFEVDPNSEAIALINKHATIFADKSKMVPATFHDSFQKFIETFKEENYPQNYLSTNGPLAHCHNDFLYNCHGL